MCSSETGKGGGGREEGKPGRYERRGRKRGKKEIEWERRGRRETEEKEESKEREGRGYPERK